MKTRSGLRIAIAFVAVMFAPFALADDMQGMNMGTDANTDTGAMGAMGAHMRMGPHMTMTESRPTTPEDLKRAREILNTMRATLGKYQDYKVAEADGYLPFMPTIPQDVYHFANRDETAREYNGDIDIAHPGSLLYVKQSFGGWRWSARCTTRHPTRQSRNSMSGFHWVSAIGTPTPISACPTGLR